ncbi:MAG: DUF1501 domain-containing protein [Caulobacteraceae bacterium]|nr:MAG: DUF1501 domain-containing protein [Caulobacteraceae bacterium]
MTTFPLSRRAMLTAGIGSVFFASGAFADEAAARRKLVVIIARGGMDGLSVTPPLTDPNYEALRGEIAIRPDEALAFDADFGLHPSLAAIHRLGQQGQLRIAPAIATPDRARSHFEAQDVLESGSARVYSSSSGWLNRTLTAMGARHVEALSVGSQAPLILRGPVQAATWSPGKTSRGERLPMLLGDLYRDDPLLSKALASGLETRAMADVATRTSASMGATSTPANQQALEASRQTGRTVAGFMTQTEGPQIVALSLDGWDTHANQGGAEGQLANRLASLDATVDGLAQGLGVEWANTVVIVCTEFGRTARINGTRGADHGTASTALVLGGALRSRKVLGDWPTLQSAKLFEDRDLAPTLDMRSLFKGVLSDHLGLERKALDTLVFPDTAEIPPARVLA